MMTSKQTLFAVAIIFIALVGGMTLLLNPSQPPTPDLNIPQPQACGIENCHGLDISCGPNIPEACTMMYQLGDGCRQFASCDIIEGQCQQVVDPQFVSCKTCVESCIAQQDADENFDVWSCESSCIASETE